MNHELDRGFTAVELLVVVALVAIFMGLALPSFKDTIERYRVSAAASEISNTLQFARSHAIATRQNVTVGQSTGCANLTDWSCGINVYLDTNSDGKQNAAEEATLKAIPSTDLEAVNVQIVPSGGDANAADTGIAYTPLGYATCVATGCSNNLGGFQIYVWPRSSPAPGPSSYTYTVCAAIGGKIRLIPQYATTTTTPACP